jgi:hypothetical protein
MRYLTVALIALQLVHPQVAAQDGGNAVAGSHVRGLDSTIRELIDHGLRYSPTFRHLVAELNASDVIVHVIRRRMPERMRGYLLHEIAEARGVRYLRIAVDPRGARARVTAIIAHELQHAIEVARRASAGRSLRLEDFFAEIADEGCMTTGCFETRTAIEIQAQVLDELE